VTKYKQFFRDMSDQHEALFLEFDTIHAGYKENRKEWSGKFHTIGQQVVDIMRDYEQRLCAGMERSKNGVYSMKLADKWWEEIKKRYSHIDLVGVKSNLD